MVPAVRSILVIRTDRLGEAVLNLPVLSVLKHAFPQATVTWMVNAELVDLLRDVPGVDRVMGYANDSHGRWWTQALRLASALRRERFDVVVVSNPKKAFHVGVWLAGIPQRVGYDRKLGWLLTHRIPDRKALGERHEVEYNLELVKTLGITTATPLSIWLPVGPEEVARVADLFDRLDVSSTGTLVACHPWTSNPKKQWPLDRVRAVVQHLTEHPGVQVLVIGGKEEEADAQHLVLDAQAQVVNLVGRLSLKELAACLQKVRVLITTDSGPMHVAAAVGTPVVALFGTEDPGSHPRRWGPWGPGHTVIHKPLQDITVAEVLAALNQYLNEIR